MRENNRQKKFLLIGIIFIIVSISIFIGHLNDSINPAVPEIIQNQQKKVVSINETDFNLTIADDYEEWSRGLMYIKELPDYGGMLFTYPDEEERTFWMKNTYIPLDIIFINSEQKIIKIHSNVPPLDTSHTYPSVYPAMYVIEINGGLASQLGIKEGDTLKIQ